MAERMAEQDGDCIFVYLMSDNSSVISVGEVPLSVCEPLLGGTHGWQIPRLKINVESNGKLFRLLYELPNQELVWVTLENVGLQPQHLATGSFIVIPATRVYRNQVVA